MSQKVVDAIKKREDKRTADRKAAKAREREAARKEREAAKATEAE
jgi:hypothetical protein